jgi:hypothetical protein
MTPEFKDRNGKTWTVDVTAGSLRRVRVATGIKLGEVLTSRESLAELYKDEERTTRVLFELCRDQLNGMTFDDFAELIHGDAIREGRDAIIVAVGNFTLPRAISKVFSENWLNPEPETLTAFAENLKNELSQTLKPTRSNESVLNSAESSASTPAP